MLLLDEPTEGLAPVIVQQIGRTVREIKQRGFTVLLVEQNFRFAQTVADRHYVMEHGQVIDMIPNHRLEASMDKLHEYLGRVRLPTARSTREDIDHDHLPPHSARHRDCRCCRCRCVRPRAQGAPTIKIGVLNDMSGPYMNTGGPTSVVCCKQALEDFGVSGKGLNVEVINADHQNKPDLAVSIARQWFDRDGVDMILDVPTSSVALAVQAVAREKNKVYLNSGAASSDLTGERARPTSSTGPTTPTCWRNRPAARW